MSDTRLLDTTHKNKKKMKNNHSRTNRCSYTTNNQLHSNLLRCFSSKKQHDARDALMNKNTALTLTLMHTYSQTTKPPPILLGLDDSLQNFVQNNVLLPLLFLLLIWYRDGDISTERQLLGTQMLLPTLIHQHRPWKHVCSGTLVTISFPHNARLVVWVG
jgi:hypothetical protein